METSLAHNFPACLPILQGLLFLSQEMKISQCFWKSQADSETEILGLLNKLLYPPKHRHGSFLVSVYNGSMKRAQIAAKFCQAILMDAASPSNCFHLFTLASKTRANPLWNRCLHICLSNFSEACMNNESGFLSLSFEDLSLILSHDSLQVSHKFVVTFDFK